MKIKINQDFFIKLFYLFVFIFFCFQNYITIQDTQSYIDNTYKRPFFYPFLINIFEYLSNDNFLKYLSVFQIILGYIIVINFSYFFIKKFNINNFFFKIILIFTIAYPYLGLSMRLGSTIFSESIAYPLFLLFNLFLIKTYLFAKDYFSLRYFLCSILVFIILVLNKKTFLILLPVMLISSTIYFLIFINYRNYIIQIVIIISALITTSIIEKTNTYFKVGVFRNISVSGSSFITGPFYLATNSDLESVRGEINQKIIKFAVLDFKANKMDRNIITYSDNNILSFAKKNRKVFSHYFNQFVYMQDLFENQIANQPFYGLSEKDKIKAKTLSSEHSTDIAWQLIKMKPKENLIFYFSNVIYGMGGYFITREDVKGFYSNVGFSGLYILVLQILLGLIFLISLVSKNKNMILSFVGVLFIGTNFINVLSVSLFQPTYDRFTFFSFQLIFFITVLVFINFFKEKH